MIARTTLQVAGKDLIVVALSGGVDSATAAAILVEQGWRVVGISLRLYDATGTRASAGGRCCGPRDLEDARQVCAHLRVPFYVADHEEEFRQAVVDDFVAEYVAGRTPNPCVRCNERIKFAPLIRRAAALGAGHVATGHYARIESDSDGRPQLLRAIDRQKDQSYFLFALSEEQLGRVLFPLGGMTKEQVRARARAYGLPNAEKAESQEICFVPDANHVAFVEQHAKVRPNPGDVVDLGGRVLGGHAGIHRFTVGQRRGLGAAYGDGDPRYVVAVDAPTRRVTIGTLAETLRSEARVVDMRWFGDAPSEPVRALVQVRHRHEPATAKVVPEGHEALIFFEQPQPAVAPGQAAVFYDGERVLGGGWIRDPDPQTPRP